MLHYICKLTTFNVISVRPTVAQGRLTFVHSPPTIGKPALTFVHCPPTVWQSDWTFGHSFPIFRNSLAHSYLIARQVVYLGLQPVILVWQLVLHVKMRTILIWHWIQCHTNVMWHIYVITSYHSLNWSIECGNFQYKCNLNIQIGGQ